jgi:hypothetical protein
MSIRTDSPAGLFPLEFGDINPVSIFDLKTNGNAGTTILPKESVLWPT